jgi:hypothetical protein
MDPDAFRWANRLCENPDNATAIEITFGGLQLIASGDMRIAVTGAAMPLTINSDSQPCGKPILFAAVIVSNWGSVSRAVAVIWPSKADSISLPNSAAPLPLFAKVWADSPG